MKSFLPLLAALTVGSLGVWACRPPVTPAPDTGPAATVLPTTTVPPTATTTRTSPEPRNRTGTLPEPGSVWTEHQTEALSIQLPANWHTSKADAGSAAAQLSAFQQDNPELVGFLGGADSRTKVAFSAQDEASASEGFTDNLNIRRTALDSQHGGGLLEITATIAAQYRQLGFDVLETTTGLEIGSLPSARVAYTFSAASHNGRTDALSGLQILVVAPDDLWILTYATTSNRFAALRPVFEESAESFRIR